MDALYVFVTTSLPKAGAQVAGLPLTLNLLLTAYVILRHPNQCSARRPVRPCFLLHS